MNEHRPVILIEDVPSDLDHQIWSNAEEEAVKGCVVQLAESNAVADHGLPTWLTIRDDVGRIE